MKEYQTDVAAFILRIALGMMFLAHGFTKLLVLTPEGTAEYFHTLGFPGFFLISLSFLKLVVVHYCYSVF